MKVAILLATYNAETYLEELLASLLEQSFEDYEIHYHDDGSTDKTLEILTDYKLKYPNIIIEISGSPTGSAKANFMYMLSQVEADYYFFCDDDDVWDKDKVAKELEKLKNPTGPTAVFCDLKVVDKNLNVISPTFFSYVDRTSSRIALSQLLIENMAPGCSMAINRQLRDLAIKLNDLSLIPMHDHFLMALAAATGKIEYVDEALILYRQTGENEVGAVQVNAISKIKRNLTDIFSGRVKAEKKAFHKQAYDLARAILSVIDKNEFLEYFLATESLGKMAKIRFYKKYNISKNSGNLWYYLWL